MTLILIKSRVKCITSAATWLGKAESFELIVPHNLLVQLLQHDCNSIRIHNTIAQVTLNQTTTKTHSQNLCRRKRIASTFYFPPCSLTSTKPLVPFRIYLPTRRAHPFAINQRVFFQFAMSYEIQYFN